MKLMLVYQAGIANVFEVERFGLSATERGKSTRVLQHAFEPCYWYCLGAEKAGVEVQVAHSNQAGDIANPLYPDWSYEIEDAPFSDKLLYRKEWSRSVLRDFNNCRNRAPRRISGALKE